jgi:hypothetical protein
LGKDKHEASRRSAAPQVKTDAQLPGPEAGTLAPEPSRAELREKGAAFLRGGDPGAAEIAKHGIVPAVKYDMRVEKALIDELAQYTGEPADEPMSVLRAVRVLMRDRHRERYKAHGEEVR